MNNEACQKTSEALNISYSYNAIASCNLKRLSWKPGKAYVSFRPQGEILCFQLGTVQRFLAPLKAGLEMTYR